MGRIIGSVIDALLTGVMLAGLSVLVILRPDLPGQLWDALFEPE